MRNRLPTVRRPLAAYHEAGHCLVRLWLGHRFDQAVVQAPAEMGRGTLLDRRDRPILTEGAMDAYDLISPLMSRDLMSRMEGCTAQQRDELLSCAETSAEMTLMECLAGPLAEARYRRRSIVVALLDGGGGDMATFNRTVENWFSGRKWEAYGEAEARVLALLGVPQAWAATKAMAEHLLAHGRLEMEQAEPLFVRAFKRRPPAFGGWRGCWPPTLEQIKSGWMPAEGDE